MAKKEKIVVEGKICGLTENDAVFYIDQDGARLDWPVKQIIHRFNPPPPEPERPEGWWEKERDAQIEHNKQLDEPCYDVNPHVRRRKDGEVSFGTVKMDDSKEQPVLVRDLARDRFIVYSNKIILD